MDETRCQPIIFSADKPSDDYQAQNVVSANGLNINATPFVPTSDRVVLFNQCLNVDSKYASVSHEESTTVNKAQVMSEDRVPSYAQPTFPSRFLSGPRWAQFLVQFWQPTSDPFLFGHWRQSGWKWASMRTGPRVGQFGHFKQLRHLRLPTLSTFFTPS
jgi:hypothetical protein